MNAVLIVLQMLLLAAALPLLATSLRTKRGRRARHTTFMSIAALLAMFALILGLISVAGSADDIHFDYAMSFTPPLFTLAMCGWVIWRALAAANRPSSSRSTRHGAMPKPH